MSLPAVSKHLKVLERAGLIARGREAQWRPCRLEASPLKDVADWVAHYRRFFDESFDRLDDYLEELKKKEKKHAGKQRQKLARPRTRKAASSFSNASSMRLGKLSSRRGRIQNTSRNGGVRRVFRPPFRKWM
jgi:DNA-binding transcriptional ArsR family regulator